ncbi:MAG: SDR family NAD(P)-dependent oxidoreductase [Verrucomicrobia bacterium]|nr:SDR family NAD(P)-dependent oxidoreductase [Verrucomicrobiota bacterium]
MRVPKVQKKNVLVTGCSSGIGAATAAMLRDAGWHVVPTARKEADLRKLKEQGFHAVELDVADSVSVSMAVNQALDIFGGEIGGLVNNAGFGQPGAMEDLTRESMRYQFEVNVLGMQELTNQVLPVMREQGWGRIINISSVAGRIGLPLLGIYSATKFAMEGMSDVLRVELAGSGVAVSLIEPGPIDTDFKKNALERGKVELHSRRTQFMLLYEQLVEESQLSQNRMAQMFTLPSESVAKTILKALETGRPKRRYKVTLHAYAGALMSRFAPDWLVDYVLGISFRAKYPKSD